MPCDQRSTSVPSSCPPSPRMTSSTPTMSSSPSSPYPPPPSPRPARRLAWLLAFSHPILFLLGPHLGLLLLPPPLPNIILILHPLSLLHLALPSLVRMWAPHLPPKEQYSTTWTASNVNVAVAAVGVLGVLAEQACREDRPPWKYPGDCMLLGAGTAVVACGMTLGESFVGYRGSECVGRNWRAVELTRSSSLPFVVSVYDLTNGHSVCADKLGIANRRSSSGGP